MTGRQSDLQEAVALRHCMYGLLANIEDNPELYPRDRFGSYDEFLFHLRMALSDMRDDQAAMLNRDPHADITTMPLRPYAEYMQPPAQNDPTRWSQLNDAILAAMFLGRTVLIVRPNLDPAQVLRLDNPPQYDEDKPRRIEAYFPDGQMMVKNL
jgi:hypothetical protein